MARRSETEITTEIPSYSISFDAEAFDEAIQTQGLRLIHYEAMRCPVGMVDLNDTQRPHPDHEGCTNGYVYTRVGEITGLATGNSKNKRTDDVGYWDGSTVQVTFPRFYDDQPERRIYVAPFDRFFTAEPSIVVPTWQAFIHSESGRDRLKYPVAKVVRLKDSAGVDYQEGEDFDISPNGLIVWREGKAPPPNLDAGPGIGNGFGADRGAVCSVRYLYRPYWYVGQIVHEIRISQLTVDAERGVERFPQAVVMHREYISQNRDQNEPGAPGPDADLMRTVLGPTNGGFGPR